VGGLWITSRDAAGRSLPGILENIDTGGPLGRANVIIIGAIAELEHNLIIERVRADESMSDHYDKIKEDVKFRKEWAEKCGFGFKLPSVVPNVPKMEENALIAIAA
jgi:hypothetical protein